MPKLKLNSDLKDFFEVKEKGTKVVAKWKFCKFAATPAPNKVGKAYFHSGNLTQHLRQKHTEQHETLVLSKKRQSSSPAAAGSTLDAFVTVSKSIVFKCYRSAEKYNVEFTVELTEFKKVAVEAITLNGLSFSLFEASGIKKMLQPIINKTHICLNRRAVGSMVINQAAAYRKSLAAALKNKLVSIKFGTASRKRSGFFELMWSILNVTALNWRFLQYKRWQPFYCKRFEGVHSLLKVSKKVAHTFAKVYYRRQTVI